MVSKHILRTFLKYIVSVFYITYDDNIDHTVTLMNLYKTESYSLNSNHHPYPKLKYIRNYTVFHQFPFHTK